MIYILEIISQKTNRKTEITGYKVLDTLSESPMFLTPIQLKRIFSSSTIQVANAKLHNNEIKVSDWVSEIATGSSYSSDSKKCPLILTAKRKDTYTVANYQGEITKVNFEELRKYINNNRIANCKPHIDTEKDLKTRRTDAYIITEDKRFEEEIDSKYKIFIAKLKLLGHGNTSFNYKIENKQVALKMYTGSSTNIVLPSFITAIKDRAFSGANIETLSLNEGLSVIGRWAFESHGGQARLKRLEIPSTVELIEQGAFYKRINLLNDEGTLNTAIVKLRNSNTIITH